MAQILTGYSTLDSPMKYNKMYTEPIALDILQIVEYFRIRDHIWQRKEISALFFPRDFNTINRMLFNTLHISVCFLSCIFHMISL